MSSPEHAALDLVRAVARLDDARAVVADQAWDRIELPAWVRDRWPRIDLTDPSTLPEPDRCAQGRPWGVDAYGSAWGTLDERWHEYADGGTRPGRCRNRWRDRDTLLCGTHLNAWRNTLADAAKRLRRHEAHERATALCRELGAAGIDAQPGPRGVELTLDTTRTVLDLLGADRDALLDVLGAVRALRLPGQVNREGRGAIALGPTPLADLLDAAGRARRHLDRTTRTTPAPHPTTGA